MAERVVDRLEAVEIEEHDRARHIAGLRSRQRLAEQLADAAAVGQARKHVHIGKVGQPLLGLADLGDVGADAAEALEHAGHVDDRIAGEADPAGAAAGAQLHLQVRERLAGEQGAAERAVAAQRGRQRVAEQLADRATEQGGHPAGNVDDAVLAIDLPQPADPAMLIFAQQQPNRFRLGADLGHGQQLVVGPAGETGDADDRDHGDADDGDGEPQVERVVAVIAGRTERDGEGSDPGHRRLGRGGKADRGDDHRPHRPADHDLDVVRLGGEGIGGKRRPQDGEPDRLGDRLPLRAKLGAAAAGPGAGLERAAADQPVSEAYRHQPAAEQRQQHVAEHAPADQQRRSDPGGREIGREQSRGFYLAVLEVGLAKPMVAVVVSNFDDILVRQIYRRNIGYGRICRDRGLVHVIPCQLSDPTSLQARF